MSASSIFHLRQRRLRSALRRKHEDALLVTHAANIRYLCGFTGSSGALVVTRNESAFFTDGRYIEQSKQEVTGADVVIDTSPLSAAAKWLRAHTIKKAGFEGQHLTVAQYHDLEKQAGRRLRLRAVGPLVEELRMVKDVDEVAKMRAAATLGTKLCNEISPSLRAGVKESDIAAELEYAARRSGAEAMSFETIVASGARSALPHGRASEQSVPARGFVILDFGVILSGYCSDLTRTVHVGAAGAQAKKLYAAVLKAQLAAIDAVRPGASVSAIDTAARQVLEREQLAQFFTHSTGHGLGLEIHEPPRIAKGQRQRLRPGMVITVEPGVYVPGEGGVRIEDMVLVTESGCEVLTSAPKEFSVI